MGFGYASAKAALVAESGNLAKAKRVLEYARRQESREASAPPHPELAGTAGPQPAAARKGITCRAKYAYQATKGDELSFPRHAIITNVNKTTDGWWQGDDCDSVGIAFFGIPNPKQGWLPSNLVEEIDPAAPAAAQPSRSQAFPSAAAMGN